MQLSIRLDFHTPDAHSEPGIRLAVYRGNEFALLAPTRLDAAQARELADLLDQLSDSGADTIAGAVDKAIAELETAIRAAIASADARRNKLTACRDAL